MDIDLDEAPCTTAESKQIKPIKKDTVHQICSGQVVLTLAVAMKELIENSIDAKANIINIHLKEYGSELLEVSDNGSGVHKDNFQALTLKHYTSKLREFDDLESISTLGFRGEALSSLCALSDVEIVSKHHSTDVATKLKYDYGGNIVSQEITARQQGTTVTLKNLFSTLPVRKKEFIKNLKKEFAKMCNLLYAYCLLPNGIKFSCTNSTAKGVKSTVVATEGHNTVRENIISVFGTKQLSSLIDVNLVTPDEKILEEYGLTLAPGDKLPFSLEFLISSALHGDGRSSTDRQFFYINQRPCEPTKVIKLINEIYRQFNNRQYPFVYLNITTKACIVDVNITPDKRQVFLDQENLLLAAVKASLLESLKDFPSTMKVQNLNISTSSKGLKRHNTDSSLSDKPELLQSFKKKSKSDVTIMSEPTFLNGEKFNVTRTKPKTTQQLLDIFRKASAKSDSGSNKSDVMNDIKSSKDEAEKKLDELIEIACKLSKEDEPFIKEVKHVDVTLDTPKEDLSQTRKEIPLKLNFRSLKQSFKSNLEADIESDSTKVKFRSNIAPETNKSAEDELNKHIKKEDFIKMEIIGQFNMGFIIAKLLNDLFIIDQHATDEKYNFEQLQENTVIDCQHLAVPKYLELTAASKGTLLEHEDIFKKSGFNFKKEEDKLFLTSVPMSDRTIFGKNDIDEMIFMLQEDSSQDKTCRPSRIRSMFASRACRKSVMIGTALSKTEMRKLVDHMGKIDQPWNCPHGRPTMRHLVNLDLISEKM
ncbi:mismatch repair endonuclease PMS2 [Anthonomus grandis grandis]|uniref:mismatch repair endonuclease PMS2 n=1 Tax=Anthonomus grandis grandis TaxID=2921223 RepID=UPI002165CA87|nr:mismatch repair endonuclease PMS2 [Anthonomus grandis grandis]